METDLNAITENFRSLTDWDSRYRYLIELGQGLPELDSSLKTKENRVAGCASYVWLISGCENGRMSFQADSDAMLVKGLLVILLAAMHGETPANVTEKDIETVFREIGLQSHLTPQRANGFVSMIGDMKKAARSFL